MLESEEYVLVNATDKTKGGPFTRFDRTSPNDDSKKSLLDLVIVSSHLARYIEKLEIDKNQEWTPCRSNGNKVIFPDHYALLLVLNNIPTRISKYAPSRKEIIWNTKRINGWENFKIKTDNNPQLLKVASSQEADTNIVFDIIEKEMTRVKFACFGKVKVYSKNKNQLKLENIQHEKQNTAKELTGDAKDTRLASLFIKEAELLKEIQRDKISKELNALKNLKERKGKSAAIFKVKDTLLGKKKVTQDQVAIKNPENGELVYSPDEIKKVSLNYCVNLLTNGKPKPEYVELIAPKETIHFVRMKEVIE